MVATQNLASMALTSPTPPPMHRHCRMTTRSDVERKGYHLIYLRQITVCCCAVPSLTFQLDVN